MNHGGLTIEQTTGPHSKTINVDAGGSGGSDIEAGIDAIHTIFEYIPELMFISVYGLIMYAMVIWISKQIKEK
jgi:hypothetical protein